MATYRIPKVTWGTSFVNTLTFGFPLDNAVAYSQYRDGSEFVQSVAGVEDAWVLGLDYYLAGDLRWIPTTDTTNPVATGWDGGTGVRGFLEWARQKNQFRWFPDKNSATSILSYLVEPMQDKPSLEPNGTRRLGLVMRNTTTTYDSY